MSSSRVTVVVLRVVKLLPGVLVHRALLATVLLLEQKVVLLRSRVARLWSHSHGCQLEDRRRLRPHQVDGERISVGPLLLQRQLVQALAEVNVHDAAVDDLHWLPRVRRYRHRR